MDLWINIIAVYLEWNYSIVDDVVVERDLLLFIDVYDIMIELIAILLDKSVDEFGAISSFNQDIDPTFRCNQIITRLDVILCDSIFISSIILIS